MQRYSALQAVEPNCARRSVCFEPQRGQAGAGSERGAKRITFSFDPPFALASPLPQLPVGGAMP